jgi:hypothetical protein
LHGFNLPPVGAARTISPGEALSGSSRFGATSLALSYE